VKLSHVDRQLLQFLENLSNSKNVSGSDLFLFLRILIRIFWVTPLVACAFFPGLYSTDSIDALRQIDTGDWNNWQTSTYIFLIYVFSIFGNVLWLPNQVFGFILLSSTIFFLMQIAKLKNWSFALLIKISFLFAISPLILLLGQMQWKDSPFVAATIFYVSLMIKMKLKDAENLAFYSSLAIFFIAALRWNGIATCIFFTILSIFYVKKNIRSLIFWNLSACALAVASLFVPPKLGVISGVDGLFFNQTRLHDLAVLSYQNPSSFTQKEIEIMERIAPLTEWRKSGSDCLENNSMMFEMFPKNAPGSYDNFRRYESKFISMWNSKVRSDTGDLVKIHICRARSSWDPTLSSYVPLPITMQIPAEGVDYGISSPDSQKVIRHFFEVFQKFFPLSLYWSAPFFTLLSGLVYLYLRLKRHKLVIEGQLLGYSSLAIFGVMLFQNTQDLRYNFSSLLLSQLILVLLIIEVSSKRKGIKVSIS
jgi:hypothetical protein